MVYDSVEEMNKVVGSLEDNSFIAQERDALAKYRKRVNAILKKFND